MRHISQLHEDLVFVSDGYEGGPVMEQGTEAEKQRTRSEGPVYEKHTPNSRHRLAFR
jgi:hypothetical protein